MVSPSHRAYGKAALADAHNRRSSRSSNSALERSGGASANCGILSCLDDTLSDEQVLEELKVLRAAALHKMPEAHPEWVDGRR
jgi:hypothetical protein